MAVDLLAERARSDSRCSRSRGCSTSPTGPTRRSTCPVSRSRAAACSASSGASSTATRTAGAARRSSPRSQSASSCSPPSSRGRPGRRSRCCRSASSRTGRSRPRTAPRSRCTSACSARSSCSRSSSRPRRATRPSSPVCACCPWTAMPMIVAPIAGGLSDRIGGRPFLAGGLALQAIGLGWIAAVSVGRRRYSSLVGPFILSGIGMGMFFAPVANVVLSAVAVPGRGQGVRRIERDPRGRRRLRRRGARVDLRQHRRLRVAGDLQRGPRRGDLGRRRRRRRRRADRALRPRQAAGRGAGERRSRRPRAAVQDVSQGLSLGHVRSGAAAAPRR